MDTALIIGIAASFLCAAGVYVVMEYRQFGERQKIGNHVLKIQTEANAARKELLGYTRYAELLASAKSALVDSARSLQAKVVREYTHVEVIGKEAKSVKPPVCIIQRYHVEAVFAFDLKPDSFQLVASPGGLEVQLNGKPSLQGIANARPLSHEISNEGILENEPVAVKQVQQKLIAIAQKQADTMATEDAICALCERKLAETLRAHLLGGAGVRQVPSITFVYK